ncbi:MAG: ABC transporter substrate-binding protein [Anaerolineae bacterium]|nr:ABC transporter substrate-binding protein [Anaerolineae bacterium]
MLNRTFARIGFLVVVVAMLAAIAGPMAPTAVAQDGMYKESPMLAAMVAAGELPSVEERLPANPAVVTPINEVGAYGGDLRFGFVGSNPGWGGMWYTTGWENLVIWKPDFSGVAPNIAESWEVSDDVREYTFHIRQGIKWSDGVEFTTDDVMFYFEDILMDPDVSKSGPAADWLPSEGADQFRAERIDDYTFKMIFANPNGTFLYSLPQWNGRHITFFPKHYLMQFHKKYNENVDELVAQEEGVEDWVGLLNKKACGPTEDTQNFYRYPERPLLFPWIIEEPLGGGTTIKLVRNPYYWKVDTEGNQLPYIDTVTGYSYQDGESLTLAMLNGDLDYYKDPSGNDRILYYDAVDEGKPLAISATISDGGVNNTIHFNRNAHDETKAAVFADKNFRIGMSHAINREELIEIVHSGQGTPAQPSPLESSPLYNEQLATQYIEYSVDLANEYLDMVLPEKDGEGYRLGPNGERFTIIFTISNDLTYGTNWVQIAELLIGYWNAVGVDVLLNSVADEVYKEIRDNNEMEATIYTGEGGAGITAILDPRYYVPGELFGMYGNGWQAWRVGAEQAEQVPMPDDIQAIRTKYEVEVLGGSTQEAQIAAMQEVLQMAADEFFVLGTARPGPGYQVYHSRLGNQPAEWIIGWIEGVQKITYPEQWYIIE